MSLSALAGKTAAILVTHGFNESVLINLQKQLNDAGIKAKMVSKENGLINGWAGEQWGLSYPVDTVWRETLAVDYDIMIIPDGDQHLKALEADSHAKRIMLAFLREKAPSLLIGGGVDLAKSLDLLGDIAPEHYTSVLMEGHVVVAGKSAEVSEMIDNLAHAVSNTTNNEVNAA
ncbi:MAG: DJ-1/PfpI family protein [Pseudomonadota bacterium]|nr:DJ-1/PfpI family protein [Pseudomonadota bacterium]